MLECNFLMAHVWGHNALGLVPVDSNKLFVRLSARPEERIASEFAVWMQNGNNLRNVSKRMEVWEPGASCGPALNTASCLRLGGWSVLLARAPRSMSDCGVKNYQI